MSWSTSLIGRAGTLAPRVADDFKKIQGAPSGTAEEAAKNALGDMASVMCASIADPNTVVKIDAQGSAWTEGGKHKQLNTQFSFSTVGTFVE